MTGLGSLPSSSSSSTHVMDSMTSATSISSSLLELSGTSFSLPKVKGSEDLPPPLVASAPLTQVSVKGMETNLAFILQSIRLKKSFTYEFFSFPSYQHKRFPGEVYYKTSVEAR